MSKIDSIQISGTVYEIQDSGATKVVNVTQAEYESLVSGGTVDPTVLYNITDAQAADLSQYWTSAQTNSAITAAVSGKANSSDVYLKTETSGATELSTAFGNKQDTLSAGTGIDITDNVISATGGGGGGKAVEAGRGISVASGDSAYTVSFNLPISAGTGINSIIIGESTNISNSSRAIATGYKTKAQQHDAFAQGYQTDAGQEQSHAEGYKTKAYGLYSHSEGRGTSAMTVGSHAEGLNTITSNSYEHTQGQYNVSNKANTTFGDSGNTLFSVGNGTSINARHNAFEIRQNGDIYITLNGQDVKLQDNLGGGEVSSAITSGDTNAVAGGAVYDKFDEVEQVTAAALNNLNDRLSEVNDTIGDINTILQSI